MRTLTLLIACMLLVNISYGQKRKVTTASSFLMQEKLDKAKEAIDEAMAHPDAVDFAKGYVVKGQIYQAIFEGKDSVLRQQNPGALQMAWESYKKAMEMDDDKKKLEKEISAHLPNLAVDFMNSAVNAHNNSAFEESMNQFQTALDINASRYGSQKIDSMAIHYAGVSAYRAGLLDKALEYYKRSMALGYDDPGRTYSIIVKILLDQSREAESAGNTALMEQKKEEGVKYLLEGIKRFPDNESMLIEVINHYLLGDNPAEAEQYLDRAIAQNTPNVDQLYRAKGMLYQKLERVEDAEAMYKKTLELNENDFISYYQLGNIELDRVIKEHEKVHAIDDNKVYERELKKVMSRYEDVLPFFEKALSLDPTDKNTLETLSRLYYQLRNQPQTGKAFEAKYNQMQERLDLLRKN